MRHDREQNENDEVVMFEIYPIWRKKRTGNDDFRFVCLLPGSSKDTHKKELNSDNSESLLLFSSQQEKIVGEESFQSDPQLFPEIVITERDTITHLYIGIVDENDGPIASSLRYVLLHNKLKEYFMLMSIIAKCGLKLRYKKLTRDLIAASVLSTTDYHKEVLPPLYSVDEVGFLKRKFVMELSKHEGLGNFYRNIRDLFLNLSVIEESFFKKILDVGAIIPDIMPVSLLSKQN